MDATPAARQRRTVDRVSRTRAVGLGLGLAPVLVVLSELHAPAIVWVLAVANGLLWPWVARRLALTHAQPIRIERRNLMIDSAMGGVWVALMQFNLVPSVVLGSLLLMDKFAFGGTALAWRCFLAFAAAALAIGALNGFAAQVASSTWSVVACLPLLVVYPSMIALAAWSLAERVRRQGERLEALSRTDELTGLANRRALMEAVEHEFRRFRRGGYRASVMMIDVDRFKVLNDMHGHAAGDAALRTIADVLRRTLRDTDTCGRLGGDEFGIVLTDAHGSGVGDLAERLRIAVAQAVPAPGLPPLTVSIGHAQIDVGMAGSAQWLAAADAALYRAKATGRNRAVAAPLLGQDGP